MKERVTLTTTYSRSEVEKLNKEKNQKLILLNDKGEQKHNNRQLKI